MLVAGDRIHMSSLLYLFCSHALMSSTSHCCIYVVGMFLLMSAIDLKDIDLVLVSSMSQYLWDYCFSPGVLRVTRTMKQTTLILLCVYTVLTHQFVIHCRWLFTNQLSGTLPSSWSTLTACWNLWVWIFSPTSLMLVIGNASIYLSCCPFKHCHTTQKAVTFPSHAVQHWWPEDGMYIPALLSSFAVSRLMQVDE
jgi:hypothetical protein